MFLLKYFVVGVQAKTCKFSKYIFLCIQMKIFLYTKIYNDDSNELLFFTHFQSSVTSTSFFMERTIHFLSSNIFFTHSTFPAI